MRACVCQYIYICIYKFVSFIVHNKRSSNGASQLCLAVIAKLNKANGKTSPLTEKQLKSKSAKKAKKINNFWISSCCWHFGIN